jgi:ABC-type transport system substrate-binding protein
MAESPSMFHPHEFSMKRAISRIATIIVVVIIVIIIIGAGAYVLLSRTTSTSSPTTSPTSGTSGTSSTTTTPVSIPSTFTYEQTQTIQFLDPDHSYYSFDFMIMQNVYETLLSYNGTSSTLVVPWLAQSYTVSSDGKTVNFTLRQGIKFADGETLNSTAVYFSLNRLLVMDGSWPSGHGTQASWILQQLENTSLSTTLCGCNTTAAGFYTTKWLNEVLAQDFIQITGPYTFTMHIQNPNAALPYLLANNAWADIIAPDYVMQKDIAMWNASSNGYTLPYKSYSSLTGNSTQMIDEYFQDEIATCNSGVTPSGCGATYLDQSQGGSLAGTGPYVISSYNPTTKEIDLTANTNYWGGAYPSKIKAQIPNIKITFQPDDNTRKIDIQNAARSGQAMAIDVTGPHLYDFADRNQWLNNNKLVSDVPGVSIYGPYSSLNTLFDPFDMNVTNPNTGHPYTFQPFADRRIRLAFADSINMTAANLYDNNKLGQVAINVVAPGLNPPGVYNTSNTPIYSYNPDEAANLLLQAAENPIKTFNLPDGKPAPPGMFNNTFGCPSLPTPCAPGTETVPSGCGNPCVINMYVASGDTVDTEIFDSIASVINNITYTYNLGWSVSVSTVPSGQLLTQAFSGYYYFYSLGWFADYPWVTDFLGPMYAPSNTYTGPDGWNLTQMATLYSQARADTASNNTADLIRVTNEMNTLANQEVMYLWTFNAYNILVITSNVQGVFNNPALSTNAAGDALELFWPLY